MRGARASARANATRWRCPPESVCPRSPTTVSYPFGSSRMNRSAEAIIAERTDLVAVDRVVERDVLAHARREQEALLEHDRGRLTELQRVCPADVDAADAHGALVRIRETHEQLDHRRLADAGRPDDRHRLTRLDIEAHAVQDRLSVVDQVDVAHGQPERAVGQMARGGPAARP